MTNANHALYEVLRCHGLGELAQQDLATLRAYQETLVARIVGIRVILQTTNRLKSQTSDLRADVRWYSQIHDEIAVILTKKFHSEAIEAVA